MRFKEQTYICVHFNFQQTCITFILGIVSKTFHRTITNNIFNVAYVMLDIIRLWWMRYNWRKIKLIEADRNDPCEIKSMPGQNMQLFDIIQYSVRYFLAILQIYIFLYLKKVFSFELRASQYTCLSSVCFSSFVYICRFKLV